MIKLFDESIEEVFNDRFKNYDSVDRAKMHELLLIKELRNFYFTVGLKFIEKHLTAISKK
ncbi:unnamed protein product [marine sediment metagenome]|uniref:Uncharacterized protein n=1 Tax=marine sediment metagenome TaxID=412755 RepID=X0XAP3_9ZZZZ